MPIPQAELHGTEADGSPSESYCKYCYQGGDFTAKEVDMDAFIEATARWKLTLWVSAARKPSRSWAPCCRI